MGQRKTDAQGRAKDHRARDPFCVAAAVAAGDSAMSSAARPSLVAIACNNSDKTVGPREVVRRYGSRLCRRRHWTCICPREFTFAVFLHASSLAPFLLFPLSLSLCVFSHKERRCVGRAPTIGGANCILVCAPAPLRWHHLFSLRLLPLSLWRRYFFFLFFLPWLLVGARVGGFGGIACNAQKNKQVNEKKAGEREWAGRPRWRQRKKYKIQRAQQRRL